MGLRALFFGLVMLAGPVGAQGLRIATYDPGLSRKGPGLLLRDLTAGEAQAMAAVAVIAALDADALLLTGFDWDYHDAALTALRDRLRAAGLDYRHYIARPGNRGRATGLDLDADGRLGEGDDSQGFATFTGQGMMVLLAKYPLRMVHDYTEALWAAQPGHLMPPSGADVTAVQRLSSSGHWDVEMQGPGGDLRLLALAASPPVFDGPEDRNGRRNHDEITFFTRHIPDAPYVVLGKLNLDPVDGEGRAEAFATLLNHTVDSRPASEGGARADQAGVNARHQGDPALDTAQWDAAGPGNLRVDYVLPSPGLRVQASGVLWPVDGPLVDAIQAASAHRPVWLDIKIGDGGQD